jgi:hypothetical protein
MIIVIMVGKQQLAMRRSDDAGIFSSFVAREFVGEDRILTSCSGKFYWAFAFYMSFISGKYKKP